MTYNIVSAKRKNDGLGGEFIEVHFQLFDDGELVDTRTHGYPLGTSDKDIKTDLAKVAVTHAQDLEIGARNKAQDDLRDKADNTIEKLVDKNK